MFGQGQAMLVQGLEILGQSNAWTRLGNAWARQINAGNGLEILWQGKAMLGQWLAFLKQC
jgi:hypothetical protein